MHWTGEPDNGRKKTVDRHKKMVDLVQDFPQSGVVVLMERIQVASQATGEHHRLLVQVRLTTVINVLREFVYISDQASIP